MSPYRELFSEPKKIKTNNNNIWSRRLKCFLYGHDYLGNYPDKKTLLSYYKKYYYNHSVYYNYFELISEVYCTRCEKCFKPKNQSIVSSVNLSEFMEVTKLLTDNFHNLFP